MEIYKNLDLENIEGEEWKPVLGYNGFEGLYAVSNMGRVKSLKNRYGNPREKILRQGKMKNGYLYVVLCKEGKMKTCYVHRLVGNAFLDNPNNYPCYNHKNEIKTDNRAENLEPCTYQYNLNYGSRTAKVAEKLTNGVLSKQVYQYDKDGNLIKIWDSTMECGRNGFIQVAVCNCCNGKRKFHKGYLWSYTPLL